MKLIYSTICSIWGASLEKGPTVLIHCHTKRRMDGYFHFFYDFFFQVGVIPKEGLTGYPSLFFWDDNDSGH